jgi:hypothetical protein
MDTQEGFLTTFGMTVGLGDTAKMQSIFALDLILKSYRAKRAIYKSVFLIKGNKRIIIKTTLVVRDFLLKLRRK